MKKLMIVAAMLAMALATAAPAFAQQTSGDASFSAALANKLGNQCAQIINQQNTGNVQNNALVVQEQDVAQVNAAEVVAVGSDVEVNQTNTNAQNATINQVGVLQAAFAAQDCMQALTIK